MKERNEINALKCINWKQAKANMLQTDENGAWTERTWNINKITKRQSWNRILEFGNTLVVWTNP